MRHWSRFWERQPRRSSGRCSTLGLPIPANTTDICPVSGCGSMLLIRHIRELVRHLQSNPGPRFPILLESVIYDGTHCGDCLSSSQARGLLEEINVVLQSSDILSELERNFFESVRRLCQASIQTGNPIVF